MSWCALNFYNGEDLRVNLAILESARGQKWEDALLEAQSPNAKQVVAGTSNELESLIKAAMGTNFLGLR